MSVSSSTLYGGVLRSVVCFHCAFETDVDDLKEDFTYWDGIAVKFCGAVELQFV